MPIHVRWEEHPNRSTWPKLNKFPNCSKTTLEGVVRTEKHTHGQIRSTWLHLMTPNVPGAQLSHQVPPAKSCCWGTGFGTLQSWGGERRGAHRARHTCLFEVHSLKVSIYTKRRPWLCSEACLHLGVTKEGASCCFWILSCTSTPLAQLAFCVTCSWTSLNLPLFIHSFSNHSVQPTRVPKRWTSLENFLAGNFHNVLPFFSPKRRQSHSEMQTLWLPKCSDHENSRL